MPLLAAGLHGYSHMTGGWEGGQAEYARVAFADNNLLRIPDEGPDEKYLLLSVRALLHPRISEVRIFRV